jgi:hypothetical protein
MLGAGTGCSVEITGAGFFAAGGAFLLSGGAGGVGPSIGGAGTGASGSGSIRRAMICGGMLAARRAVSTRSGTVNSMSACSATDAAIA